MEDLTGKELGQYRIISPLGEGGMAAVYKAFQPGTDRYVALKILPRHYSQDPAFRARFQQEAQIIARFQHPHVLPVFDYGDEDGYVFLVMPLIQGGNLKQRLNGEPLDLYQVRRITVQVGDALDYAHAYDVIHRDVKPGNILVDERENALLADFGIAKIIGDMASVTGTGQTVGTPAYMSPEQIKGEALDGRSDVYSLGIVLYEMVTGRTPFRAETPPALYVKHLLDPLPLPSSLQPGVPEAVEKVILKSLAKNPDDRFASASAMVAAIKQAVDADPQRTINAPVVLPPGMEGDGKTAVVKDSAELPATPVSTGSEPTDSRWHFLLWAVLILAVFAGAVYMTHNLLQPVGQPAGEEATSGVLAAETGRFVDGGSGQDAGACDDPAAPCASINYAAGQALSDDEIWITAGEYVENVKLKDGKRLFFKGGFDRSGAQWVAGEGETVINGNQTDSVIEIRAHSDISFDNITITGGMGWEDDSFGNGCGGFKIQDSDVVIRRSQIVNNDAGPGGGGAICAAGDHGRVTLRVEESVVQGNRAGLHGAAFSLFNTTTTIINSLIVDNAAQSNVANVMVLFQEDDVTIINSTVADNNPTGDQAILIFSGHLTVHNSILWNNALNVQADPPCVDCFVVSYSDVQGYSGGEKNINANPLFRETPVTYYQLTSDSPCIDAGSRQGAPATDIEGRPRENRPDMGAYEAD